MSCVSYVGCAVLISVCRGAFDVSIALVLSVTVNNKSDMQQHPLLHCLKHTGSTRVCMYIAPVLASGLTDFAVERVLRPAKRHGLLHASSSRGRQRSRQHLVSVLISGVTLKTVIVRKRISPNTHKSVLLDTINILRYVINRIKSGKQIRCCDSQGALNTKFTCSWLVTLQRPHQVTGTPVDDHWRHLPCSS